MVSEKLDGIGLSEQVCFQFRFKERERVYGTKIRGEGVPKTGSRAAECSTPLSDKAGRGNRKLKRGGGAE